MKTKIAAIVLTGLLALVLTGCDDGVAERGEKIRQAEEDRYNACIEAGGSYKTNGWDGSWECIIKEEK